MEETAYLAERRQTSAAAGQWRPGTNTGQGDPGQNAHGADRRDGRSSDTPLQGIYTELRGLWLMGLFLAVFFGGRSFSVGLVLS